MLILDKAVFLAHMKGRGIKSIRQLAQKLGVHRNSISIYLRGKGVLQPVVQAALDELGLDNQKAFATKPAESDGSSIQKMLAPLIDLLVTQFPQYSFILFGSRAGGRARRYSDIDIGVQGSAGPLQLSDWSKIRDIVDGAAEDLPYLIDVVDLGRADQGFLQSVKKRAIFLGGSLSGWANLQT